MSAKSGMDSIFKNTFGPKFQFCRKTRYKSTTEAAFHLLQIRNKRLKNKETRVEQTIYFCNNCQAYHLSSLESKNGVVEKPKPKPTPVAVVINKTPAMLKSTKPLTELAPSIKMAKRITDKVTITDFFFVEIYNPRKVMLLTYKDIYDPNP